MAYSIRKINFLILGTSINIDWQILSDSDKRFHYDNYLFSQRKIVQKISKQGSSLYTYESHITVSNQMEVVEWLRSYRLAINEIVAQRKVVVGSGYFAELEGEFYSAIQAAFYGPLIESMDLLPDCFEADERSVYETSEVLHLVSGRDLFGIVCLVNKLPELSHTCYAKLSSFTSVGSNLCQSVVNTSIVSKSGSLDNGGTHNVESVHNISYVPDVYKELELHISGKVVAVATRVPPKSCRIGIQNKDSQDHIHVFLRTPECSVSNAGSRFLLGTVTGIGTNPEEGSCFVYNNFGTKTHVVMKHRTLMVKHLHWYEVGDEVSVCECRCSRARLPPSKYLSLSPFRLYTFWLFEPRCSMHDIGGWYIETFGRNKEGRTVPSQRQWDGFAASIVAP
ncbi:hypothetical protein GIB67_030435 [Kingdonia uniflora]|uniref:Uncharacterized protein n=1 Tax=Kingdonia uniflora TaxID=39325 RepID=A0A7J7NDT9_9MAGN|nr:hypothetical protein GIB67_030435 [Kingdonia uniflora]